MFQPDPTDPTGRFVKGLVWGLLFSFVLWAVLLVIIYAATYFTAVHPS